MAAKCDLAPLGGATLLCHHISCCAQADRCHPWLSVGGFFGRPPRIGAAPCCVPNVPNCMGLGRRAKYQHGAVFRLPSDMIVIHFLNMPSDMISTCRYVLLLTALPGCHVDTERQRSKLRIRLRSRTHFNRRWAVMARSVHDLRGMVETRGLRLGLRPQARSDTDRTIRFRSLGTSRAPQDKDIWEHFPKKPSGCGICSTRWGSGLEYNLWERQVTLSGALGAVRQNE